MKKFLMSFLACLICLLATCVAYAENTDYMNPRYSLKSVKKIVLDIDTTVNEETEKFTPLYMHGDIFLQELVQHAGKKGIIIEEAENSTEPKQPRSFFPETVKLEVYCASVGTLRDYYALPRHYQRHDYRRNYRMVPRKEYNPHTGKWETVPVPVYDNSPVITYDNYSVCRVVYTIKDIVSGDIISSFADDRMRQDSDPKNLVKRSVKSFFSRF